MSDHCLNGKRARIFWLERNAELISMNEKPMFVEIERTRHGRRTVYFRVGKGPRIRLPDDMTSPEFAAAYKHSLLGTEKNAGTSPAPHRNPVPAPSRNINRHRHIPTRLAKGGAVERNAIWQ